MDDLQRFVVTLPENIKEGVRALFDNNYKTWEKARMNNLWKGLGKRGYHELIALDLAQRGPPWQLTSLGKDVYQLINGKES